MITLATNFKISKPKKLKAVNPHDTATKSAQAQIFSRLDNLQATPLTRTALKICTQACINKNDNTSVNIEVKIELLK